MRIGVDATCWANGRGYGRFTRELVPAMARMAADDTFLCFVDRRAAQRFDLSAHNVELIEVPQRTSPTTAAAAEGYRSPTDMLRFTRAVWRVAPDVFFSPTVYTYFPLPPGLRAVVTVHDTIAERYPALTLPTRRDRIFWKLKVKLALKQARFILTVSEFAAREIVSILGVDEKRIRVAVEAPAPVFGESDSPEREAELAARSGIPRGSRWFTYVGGFNPHKRVDVLIEAHAQVVRQIPNDPPHLLLIGTRTDDVFHRAGQDLDRLITAAGTDDLVHWTGFVEDGDLRYLHAGSVAAVLPSECEGFGLPAVEAAACGAPVIATQASPLPELLEGGGIFVAPGEPAPLAQAMMTLVMNGELAATLGKRARDRASALEWNDAAQVALDALSEAAA
ncbi:MAG: glycosyltransferase family 4 protein [Gemmatimonadales bacterium]|nr:glycosyltransferase family 4 protein [Gemmatimonadales bacterium]